MKRYVFPGILILVTVFLLAVTLGAWEQRQPAQFVIDPDRVQYIELYYDPAGDEKELWNEVTDQAGIEDICNKLRNLYLIEFPYPETWELELVGYSLFKKLYYGFTFHMKNGSTKEIHWSSELVHFDNHWCFAVGGENSGYDHISAGGKGTDYELLFWLFFDYSPFKPSKPAP